MAKVIKFESISVTEFTITTNQGSVITLKKSEVDIIRGTTDISIQRRSNWSVIINVRFGDVLIPDTNSNLELYRALWEIIQPTYQNPLPVTIDQAVDVEVKNTVDVNIVGGSISIPAGIATEAKQDDEIDLLTTIDTDTSNISTKIDTVAGDTTSIDNKLVALERILLNTNPTGSNYGLITNSIIHGKSSAGGGTYVDVKVNPSGSLLVVATQDGVWDIQATDLDVRNLVFATDKVDVSGSSVTATVSATNLDIRDLVFATDKVDASGSSVSISSLPNEGQQTMANSISVAIASDQTAIVIGDGGGSITVDGSVSVSNFPATYPVTDNGGSLTVDGTVAFSNTTIAVTNIGTFAVQAAQSGSWILSANSGVDIGDVTINNAVGAGAVNIQDGGNSITVDGSVTVSNMVTQYAEDSGHSSGHLGFMNLAVRNDSLSTALSGTNLDYTPISVNAYGQQYSIVSDTNGYNAFINPLSGQVYGELAVGGGIDHDVADQMPPVKIGSKSQTSLPASVANNDRANAISDVKGRILISHIDPGMQTWKSFNATTTQTGAAIWTPSAGKKVAINSLSVSSYGTTAFRCIIWFGSSSDTTYTAGTDQLVWAGSFAPSTTQKPFMTRQYFSPIFANSADYVLRITTDAAGSVDVEATGYEF